MVTFKNDLRYEHTTALLSASNFRHATIYSESSVITFTTGPSYACLAWNMYMRVAKPIRPTNSTHAQLKFTGVTS